MPLQVLRDFIKLESSGGIVLFFAAVLALILDNTPLHVYYQAFFHIPLSFKFGAFHLEKPLLLWINDGFMAIFFLLVGLEIKYELIEGELNTLSKAMLPAVAAVGGMVVPALVYLAINHASPEVMRGWAIPTATDIAFSLGILSLLGKRIPMSLKIFLTALAIFDDLGAIVVIAIFYTKQISVIMLLISAMLILLLYLLNRRNVTNYTAYFIVGIILWVCVLKSGVHATLTGIFVAFAIPLRDKKHPGRSPLKTLEHYLHPWVAFMVLPVFAFANAGVSFAGLKLSHLFSSLPLGIAAGLFIGKQVGIWGISMLAVKAKIAELPSDMSGMGVYGISALAGVGFTMSLFIGGLAFGEANVQYAAYVRFGVLVGSILSGILGYCVLQKLYPKSPK
ncbi:MAG: Na+/H+ antiporter NhaA [Coxiella sp. (in: Bacteria)]|nr:MAG: Na+/H+ antiporter NhaA [Coxiella sp. (in: g-proteobacteria)]